MRKAPWITGAAVVLLLLAVALTFDPLGLLPESGNGVRTPETAPGPMVSEGLRGVGRPRAPDADPREWEGDPVGRLVLHLGQGTLRGSVTGEDRPLRFARVRAVLPPPYADLAVRTGKDGRWEIAGLADGRYEVDASAAGHVGRTVVAPPLAGPRTVDVGAIDLLARHAPRNVLAVRVTDAFGVPLRGARVVATTMPWTLFLSMGPERAGYRGVKSATGVTDESGRVQLGPLPAEEYGVVASAPAHVTEAVDHVVVGGDRTRHVHLELPHGVSVSGRVLGSDGSGVEGAVVMGMALPAYRASLTAHTEPDGSFVLDGLRKGDYMFVGWQAKEGSSMVPGIAPGHVDIKLKGTGHVHGRVRYEDGTPAAHGVVRPFQFGPFQYVYSLVYRLDADGSFAFDLPKGTWDCRVQSDEGYVTDQKVENLEVGETREVDIRLPKGRVVRGVVMDQDGNHLEGAEVFVMQGGFPATPSREQYARSDADGRFEVPGLGTGTVDLHVRHGDYVETKLHDVQPEPPESAHEHSVRLGHGARLVGHVLDAQGNGVAHEQVNYAQTMFAAHSTFTDPEGAYAFAGVPEGTYMVTTGPFEPGARGQSRDGVAVGGGGTVTVDFRYPAAAGKVTGTVTRGGAPVPGAQVTLTDARGPDGAVRVTADAKGRFEADGLQYGSVRVEAQAPGGATGRLSTTLAEGAAAPDVTVDIGTCSVHCRVLDPSGEPVPACWVSVEVAGGESTGWSGVKDTGNTDAQGVFRSRSLEPGRYLVRINGETFAQYVSPAFTLAEGEARDLGEVRLAAGALLQGVVRDDAGAPVENATVSLRDTEGRPVELFSMATSGSDGRYALHGVQPGRYTVHFEARGHAPDERPVTLGADGGRADGVLTRGGGVAVRVEDRGGKPVAGVRVRLYDERGHVVTRTISLANFDSGRRVTGADGTTGLGDLAQGTYVVACEKEGYAVVGDNPRARVEPGTTAQVRVVVEALP